MMKNVSDGKTVNIAAIQVPEKYRRRGNAVEDDKLRQSIERTGVQQPLVVSDIGEGKYVLIDGYRRLEVARFLKLPGVPCVIDEVPEGAAPEDYRDRMRFILDEHRQDLFPTQRAMLIKTLQKNFKMNNRQVGEYLGVDATTIGNWLMIESYVREVASAVDAGDITQHAARVFEGMTPAGQRKVWTEHRTELKQIPPAKLHRELRQKYHPRDYPELYVRPEKIIQQLDRVQGKRTAKRRPVITKADREMLSSDIELREAELRDAERDLERYKLENTLAARIIRAILQNDKLKALIPPAKVSEFKRFAEIY
jgi:ParB/RepB/Spo0J family partition protein